MNRYCTNCQKEFKFKVDSVTDMDNLVCPECGQRVYKDSRKPRDYQGEAKIEETIGGVIYGVMFFLYCFFLIMGILGIIAFFLKWDTFLYIDTVISVVAYQKMHAKNLLDFSKGSFWFLVGAGIGFLCYKTLQGACLGIMIVFVIRHLFRAIIMGIIGKLISWARRA